MVEVLCHMCGETRERTPEHHYPKWMRKILPIENTPSFNYATGKMSNKDTGVRTIMEICKVCNEGWMAKLQDKAKPIIAPLLKQTRMPEITDERRKIIAQWFTMFTMVYENDNPHRVFAVQENDRRQFVKDQSIPDKWEIWIGFNKQMRIGGRGASHLPTTAILQDGTVVPYQTTIAEFGHLMCVSSSGLSPRMDAEYLPQWGFNRIWPIPEGKQVKSLPRFPRMFHPRILSDVLDGSFTTPESAIGFPMGLRGYHRPPPGFNTL